MPRKSTVVRQDVSPTPVQPLLDVQGVSALLKVSRAKVFELMRDEGLPRLHWGKRTLRFDPRAIAIWLEKQQVAS